MRCLIDTNILLRFVNTQDTQHPVVAGAIEALSVQGAAICIVPQNMYEFWAVASRPQGVNDLGWKAAQLQTIIQTLQTRLLFLDDPPELFATWLELVATHEVSGKPSHDARLAAAMQVHGLDALLTFNGPDFKRFGVQIIHPADLPAPDPTSENL